MLFKPLNLGLLNDNFLRFKYQIKWHWTTIVKLLFYFRSGLIKARLAGARLAKGKVLIFLDAHCECADGWINPLLKRINESPKSVVVPLIDVMDPKTFEYQTDGYGFDVISF